MWQQTGGAKWAHYRYLQPSLCEVFSMKRLSPDAPLILVADDNKSVRVLLRETMEEEGYRVVEAQDGEECLTQYLQLQPDMVLLDAIMPAMDGFRCCTKLRTLEPSDRTPILMITGLDDQVSVDQAFAAGATDYVTKPIHLPVLRQRVRRLLQASKAMEELRQQTEWERLMGIISQRIRQSLNLEDILNTTVVEVRQFLQADRVLICRFEPDWSGKIAVESVAPQWDAFLGQTIQDPCLALTYVERYKKGYIRAIEDIYTAGMPSCHVRLLETYQVRANLVVPILQGERLWGLLITHHCSGPRRWQQSEIKLIEHLTTQLAIAIQQSELYQQVQHLNADLERQVQERTAQLQKALTFEAMLKRITDKVRDSLDENQILQTATQELASGLGICACGTALYDLDPDSTSIRIRHEYTTSNRATREPDWQIANAPEIYAQLAQGQYFQFCKIAPCESGERLTVLACPIFDDQGILGDLWVINCEGYTFNEIEIRLVLQVTNQCAIAIRQARLYQAAQAQVQELEKLNRLKDEFLSTVSHELRTPMSSMKMATHMLEVALDQERSQQPTHPDAANPRKADRYLQILKTECDREISLIEDLLDLQRLDAGNQPLNLQPIHLQSWLRELAHPFQAQANRLQRQFDVDLPATLPDLISDTDNLERVLKELLTNACKYTPAGEQIQMTARHSAEHLQIQVSNSGVEISLQEQTRIFDKFYRILSNDPWKQGGTGLGLSLVKKLMAHLGGAIYVESADNHTHFTIELPLAGPAKN